MDYRMTRYGAEATDLHGRVGEPLPSFRRVLLPVDGRETSDWILDRTWTLLNRADLSVTLLHVVRCGPLRADDSAFRADPRHEASCRVLREYLHRCRTLSAGTRAFLRFGDPVTEILQETSTAAYDLLIMGSHGRVGLNRWISGSVAEQVLRFSPVPILILHPLLAPDESISSAQGRDPAGFRRLLVALDGFEAAEEILPMAEAFARSFGSELLLFSASVADRALGAGYLEKWESELTARGLRVRVARPTGRPVEDALELVRAGAADSIAIMSHGRSGLSRTVHGSMTQRLIREAGVPVLAWCDRRRLAAPEHPESADSRRRWID